MMDTTGDVRFPPPPGLSSSDAETATVSRERRRVAVAAREVIAALSEMIMNRFDALEAKVDILGKHHRPLETRAHETNLPHRLLTINEDLSARMSRLEALITIYPENAPSVDEVLNELLERKRRCPLPGRSPELDEKSQTGISKITSTRRASAATKEPEAELPFVPEFPLQDPNLMNQMPADQDNMSGPENWFTAGVWVQLPQDAWRIVYSNFQKGRRADLSGVRNLPACSPLPCESFDMTVDDGDNNNTWGISLIAEASCQTQPFFFPKARRSRVNGRAVQTHLTDEPSVDAKPCHEVRGAIALRWAKLARKKVSDERRTCAQLAYISARVSKVFEDFNSMNKETIRGWMPDVQFEDHPVYLNPK